MGIRAFIFSGHPYLDEARHFGAKALPNPKICSPSHAVGRVPATTPTSLGTGGRQ